MTKEKEKKIGKDQLLLEASRLGQLQQLETILSQMQHIKSKKKSNPLASLRKTIGPNSVRDPVTGFTCLHHAALNGHSKCVELILDHGAKLNAVDYKGSSALHLAAWAGNQEVVKILLSHRRAASIEPPPDAYRTQPTGGNGEQQQLQPLNASLDIDLCNNDNQTALSLAAQFGHSQVVAELLAHGANLQLRNSQLESPLELACLNGRLETVDLLLRSSSALVADLRRPYSSLPATPSLGSPSALGVSPWQSPAPQSDGSSGQSPSSARRPSVSSGWSSLLRGRRDSSSAGQQSPLHRLTAGTLSMRQRSPAGGQTTGDPAQLAKQDSVGSPSSELRDRRRSTLTVGANNQPQFAQQLRQTSLDSGGWSTARWQQQATDGERLLDHSPLHYAVRRGHANVVDLLLGTYQANLLQLTTTGSVLHEIAVNNGKHSDMIGLLFACLGSQLGPPNSSVVGQDGTGSRPELLDKFLNLKNAQGKNVFEVLNEINNRSAQEMKRLIYEFSEQLVAAGLEFHRNNQNNLQGQQPTLAQQQVVVGPSASSQQQQQQQRRRLLQNPANAQTMSCNSKTNNLDRLYSSQQQQQQRPQQAPMQFSDSNALDSFVTMKRVQKHKYQSSADQQQFHQIPMAQTSRPANSPLDQMSFLLSQQQQKQQEMLSNQMRQQQAVAMTRSVSNLSRGPTNYQGQSEELAGYMMGQRWPNQWQSAGDDSNAQSNLGQLDEATRKRRSRSRDLGSLLLEAQCRQQLEANQQVLTNERLYDGSVHQLVRSHTDCSHLMNRFSTGDRSPRSSYSLANATTGYNQQIQYQHLPPQHQHQQHQQQQQQLGQVHQQHAATLDRKAINRHYHVYDHQFYPPRLVQEGGQKQAVAVVQPLEHATEVGASGGLRASIRSTASVRSQQLPERAARNTSGSASLEAEHSNSRLSLNVDPTTRRPLAAIDQNQQQQQVHRVAQARKPQTLATDFRSVSVEQSKQLPADGQQQASRIQEEQEQTALSNSVSFDSHLSEPHLFETTRQALLHDFDQIIGRELLNRDHRQIIDGGKIENSVLTGVMLDMDRHGDRLTISGTRVTLPEPSQVSRAEPQHLPPTTANVSAPNSCNQSNRSVSPLSLAGSCSTQTSQTSHARLRPTDEDELRSVAPPKPPRLSLLNKSSSASSASRKSSTCENGSVIYDLPATAAPKEGARTSLRAMQRNKPQSSQMPNKPIKGSSLTDPPKMRPPPPPVPPNKPLAIPLHVTATVEPFTTGAVSSTSSSSSAGSGISVGGQIGLLKMATVGPTVPPPIHRRSASSEVRAKNHQAKQQQVVVGADPDSGVCTSNSPASMSHDSEEPSAETELPETASKRLKQTQECSSAVVRHLARARTPIPEASPPSPQTAQLCIEAALKPLAKPQQPTNEVANQTTISSPENCDQSLSPKSSCPSESLFRWLEAGRQSSKGDYENCQYMQSQLRLASCQSISRLLASSNEHLEPEPSERLLLSPRKSHTSLSSTELAGSEEDYAESASTSDGISSSPAEPCATSGQQQQQRKEVLLKVVVDESDQGANGDEVFYMNPSELRKIATSEADAATLTDEELCAAIDQDSGFIKFTLRKRRNISNGEATTPEPPQNSLPDCGPKSTSSDIKTGGSKPKMMNEPIGPDSCLKKTKLVSEPEVSKQNQESKAETAIVRPTVPPPPTSKKPPPNPKPSKMISAEVSETDSDLSAGQLQSASSSSSKESIKSIVSLNSKVSSICAPEKEKEVAAVVVPPSELAHKDTDENANSQRPPEKVNVSNIVALRSNRWSTNVPVPKSASGGGGGGGSLVGEVVRKLEAVAAQKAALEKPRPNLKPVAAVRLARQCPKN